MDVIHLWTSSICNTNLRYILLSSKIFFSFEDIFKSQILCLESCKAQRGKVRKLLSHLRQVTKQKDHYKNIRNCCIHRQISDDNCDALRDFVPFVQFKKREKHPWRIVTFRKVAGFKHPWRSVTLSLQPASLPKVTLLHGCFSHFLNCTNSTKSCKVSQLCN